MTENEPLQNDVFMNYFSNNRHRLFRFIYSMVPIEADAEDVFQQTSIVLWKKFADFDQDREFYPWACRIAYHCTLNFRRSAKRHRFVLNDELIGLIADERAQSSARDRFRQEMVKECIALLSAKDQQLVAQVYEDGAAVKQVAEKAQRAMQTIYNRLNLIRKQLIECVDRKTSAG